MGFTSVAQTDNGIITFHDSDYKYQVSVNSIVKSIFDDNDSITKYLNIENWIVKPLNDISIEDILQISDYQFNYFDLLVLIYDDKKSVTILYKKNSKQVKFKRQKNRFRQNVGIGGGSTKSLILFDRKLKKEFVNQVLWRNIPC